MFDIDYDALARQTQKIDEEIQSTFDEMADDRETALNALLEVPKQLESVNQKLDVEQEAREKSEQEAKKRDSRTFWISLFTLIVAVISLVIAWLSFQQSGQQTPQELPASPSPSSRYEEVSPGPAG